MSPRLMPCVAPDPRVANLDPSAARVLAFDVVRLLLVTFARADMAATFGSYFVEAMRTINTWQAHALDLLSAKGKRSNLAETHTAADKLASRFHCRAAGRCDERQILHDIAAALRRATEPDPRPLLGLLLHDARELLAEMRAGPEHLDALIDANTEARAA